MGGMLSHFPGDRGRLEAHGHSCHWGSGGCRSKECLLRDPPACLIPMQERLCFSTSLRALQLEQASHPSLIQPLRVVSGDNLLSPGSDQYCSTELMAGGGMVAGRGKAKMEHLVHCLLQFHGLLLTAVTRLGREGTALLGDSN